MLAPSSRRRNRDRNHEVSALAPNLGMPYTQRPMIEVSRFEPGRGSCSSPHAHAAGELAWAPTGLIFADVGMLRWSLPPSRALWIPGGLTHAAGASRDSVLLVLSVLAPSPLDAWREPTPVTMTPLLRELVLHLVDGDLDAPRRALVEALVLGSMEPVTVPSTSLPMPAEPIAARVAETLLADPSDARTLHDFGRLFGASARTLGRYFVAQTGLTFGDWRTQARLRAAMVDLSAGRSVQQVSTRVGYDTPSGFISAFRRFAGCTPGRYQQAVLGGHGDRSSSVAA